MWLTKLLSINSVTRKQRSWYLGEPWEPWEAHKACTAYSADCFRKSGTESQNKTRPKGRHQANEAGNTFTSEPSLKNVGSNYIGSSRL